MNWKISKITIRVKSKAKDRKTGLAQEAYLEGIREGKEWKREKIEYKLQRLRFWENITREERDEIREVLRKPPVTQRERNGG